MPSATVQGTEKVVAALKDIPFRVKSRALDKAVMAGAAIAKRAIESAAPVGVHPKKPKWGPIRSNIIIYKRKRPIRGGPPDEASNLLVGPSKQAFYAYFVEKGFMHRSGTSTVRRSRAGGISKTVHTGGKPIKPNRFIQRAYEASREQILAAVKAVFAEAMKAK